VWLGSIGRNSEQRNPMRAQPHDLGGALDVSPKCDLVVDVVVARKEDNRGVGILPEEMRETQDDPGPSVAVRRLHDDVALSLTPSPPANTSAHRAPRSRALRGPFTLDLPRRHAILLLRAIETRWFVRLVRNRHATGKGSPPIAKASLPSDFSLSAHIKWRLPQHGRRLFGRCDEASGVGERRTRAIQVSAESIQGRQHLARQLHYLRHREGNLGDRRARQARHTCPTSALGGEKVSRDPTGPHPLGSSPPGSS